MKQPVGSLNYLAGGWFAVPRPASFPGWGTAVLGHPHPIRYSFPSVFLEVDQLALHKSVVVAHSGSGRKPHSTVAALLNGIAVMILSHVMQSLAYLVFTFWVRHGLDVVLRVRLTNTAGNAGRERRPAAGRHTFGEGIGGMSYSPAFRHGTDMSACELRNGYRGIRGQVGAQPSESLACTLSLAQGSCCVEMPSDPAGN